MNIEQANRIIDELTYNQIDTNIKVSWLARLDHMIYTQIYTTHEGLRDVPFTPYTPETPQEQELLAQPPFDELYRWYLEMQIHDANGEIDKYNNAAVKFNEAFQRYTDFINRSYLPASGQILKLI